MENNQSFLKLFICLLYFKILLNYSINVHFILGFLCDFGKVFSILGLGIERVKNKKKTSIDIPWS